MILRLLRKKRKLINKNKVMNNLYPKTSLNAVQKPKSYYDLKLKKAKADSSLMKMPKTAKVKKK